MKYEITTFHWCFQPILERKYWKSSSITLSALSLIVIFMLSLFECITCSSSVSLWKAKLIAIVSWTIYVSGFLRSFLISFKYQLILLRYSSTDNCYYKKKLPLLVYNNLVLHAQKGSNYFFFFNLNILLIPSTMV